MIALILVGATALGVGWAGYRAARTFWMQYSDFHPPRETLAPPLAGSPLGATTLRLARGVLVKGWTLPSRNGAAVVYLHGSPGDRRSLLETALALGRAGYGAVLLDLPGHGESGGEANWDETTVEAARAAVHAVLQSAEVRHLALVGYSMGSSIAARVAALERRVGAVVLIAPFTDLAEQLRYQYRHRIPGVSEFAVLAARAAGVPVREMRTLEAAAALGGRSLMVIAGDADAAIPASMPKEIYAAAAAPKALWMVAGAGHANIREVAGPSQFDARLRAFLDEAFFGPRHARQ